jgi:hypothetical protein
MYVMCLFQSLPHTDLQSANLQQDLLSPVPTPTPLHANAEVVSMTHTSTFQFNVAVPLSPQNDGLEVRINNRLLKYHTKRHISHIAVAVRGRGNVKTFESDHQCLRGARRIPDCPGGGPHVAVGRRRLTLEQTPVSK